ncbi:aspartate kinase [Clostridium tarantellae]|uniref:Aspartokinase n=1 Tax=Clostridium tarantellae TaxID=39493 RepID=A0A6I1MPM8_9CLOT|nr:aspartate kinase [Clostridium tarantellae]MPQ45024.1 aspartate kinase [Clostridium tarantellae]
MSEIIVSKFGGSSLANSEQFKKVKNIILSNPNRKYIIPSAPGKRFDKDYKITDLLYLCHAHVTSGIPFDDVFNLIEERYTSIAFDLSINLDLAPYFKEIKNNISNGASSDYAASRGEFLNGIILAKYLDFNFIDSADIIVFDESGNYNVEKTQLAINRYIKPLKNAIIPGFYGANESGEIITFSRGGSDITGSIISAGVNAKTYENWTDVSGFLMADPRIVTNPKTIDVITYKELRELSYMGASVLHEEAIFPVREKGIPIRIKNTNIPSDNGTLIINDISTYSCDNNASITGIAGKKNFTLISIEKALMNSELGFCRKVLSILEIYDVSFETMPASIDSVAFLIDSNKLKNKTSKILDEIKRQCNPDSIDVFHNMAVLATVGRCLSYIPSAPSKIFNALSESNVNIKMIDHGSSELNILIGIKNEDFEKAMNAIYNKFVKKN